MPGCIRPCAFDAFCDEGQNLVLKPMQIGVAEGVVFDGSLVALRSCARLNEDIDHQRNFFLRRQVVKRLEDSPLAWPGTGEVLAVAPYLDGERRHAVPLRGHLEPDVGIHAWINFARHLDGSGEFALRHARLGIAIGLESGQTVGASDRLRISEPGVLVSSARSRPRACV